MDFELTDEQQLIRGAVREFAEAEVTPIAAEIDRDHRSPTSSCRSWSAEPASRLPPLAR